MAKTQDEYFGINSNLAPNTRSLMEAYQKMLSETENKDRYDAALAAYAQLAQRDEDWLRSQPAAQVARLMAAGMSRAAALQALDNSGVSPQVQTPIAGNIEQSEVEHMRAITETISASVQLFESLVQTGVQLGMAIPAIRTQINQAKISKFQSDQLAIETSQARLQYDALTDVGNFMQSMYNYQARSGKELPLDLNGALSAMQAVAYEDMPDVYTLSHDRLQKALENPYFYPALKKAHEQFSKGNYELSMELEQQRADLRISRYKPEVMFSEVAKNWADTVFEESITPVTVENIESDTSLKSSQAYMFKQQGRVAKEDADFWTTAGGHNRRALLRNQTSQEFYVSELRRLGVQYQESFNEVACQELWIELQTAKNLGPEYFEQVLNERMQNVEYRNAVLQANLYAMTKRQESAGSWYADFADWCTAYGVLGTAIQATEQFAGSAIMGSAIYEGHMLHGKGIPK